MEDQEQQEQENIEIVEELICSQEDEPKSHKTPREIARETGISHSSVRRMAKFDLNQTPFKRVKGQKLSAKDEEKRKKRAAKLLRIVLKRSLKKTFFTDENIFTVDTPRNTQRQHLQFGPYQVSMNPLNFSYDCSDFITSGKLFQICGPRLFTLLSPNFTVFLRGISRLFFLLSNVFLLLKKSFIKC